MIHGSIKPHQDAVYDGRYYSCLKIDTAYLLSNENKEACVITENGKKVLDYGDISYEGDEDYYYHNIKLDKRISSRISIVFVL